MNYDLNHNPRYGEEEALVDGVKVITAKNVSLYTFSGTRTYLIGTNSLAIVDPGPNFVDHLNAIIRSVGFRKVTHIFLTHTHSDHCDLAIKLALKVGAPIFLYGKKSDTKLVLLNRISTKINKTIRNIKQYEKLEIKKVFHGQKIYGEDWLLEVIYTPGHYFDHICLAWKEKSIIFTGDHVMGWSSTMVSLPTGDMKSYLNSLELLLIRSENLFFPGHGKPIKHALTFTKQQLDHKLKREKQILDLIRICPNDARSLVHLVYSGLNSNLYSTAENNIYAHLMTLKERGVVVSTNPTNISSKFSYNFDLKNIK